MNSKEIFNYTAKFDEVVKKESYFENLLLQEFSSEILREYFPELFNLLKQKSKIQIGYSFFNSDVVKTLPNKIKIENQTFEIGKIIYRSLKDTESVFIITCTIGEEVEKSIWKFFNDGFSVEGYILDKMASELVELSADFISEIIEKKISKSGQSISNRYSPGYCGWSVSEQQKLFSLLPENFCGIKLTSSSLMIPIKSISGIIAAGDNITKKEYECEICEEKFCYKKRTQ